MAVIVKISGKTKPESVRKALRKFAKTKKEPVKQTIADFYGALPRTYEDGLTYQKKQRNEW
jgi:hypothetical protein